MCGGRAQKCVCFCDLHCIFRMQEHEHTCCTQRKHNEAGALSFTVVVLEARSEVYVFMICVSYQCQVKRS